MISICSACRGTGLRPERAMGDPEGQKPCTRCGGHGIMGFRGDDNPRQEPLDPDLKDYLDFFEGMGVQRCSDPTCPNFGTNHAHFTVSNAHLLHESPFMCMFADPDAHGNVMPCENDAVWFDTWNQWACGSHKHLLKGKGYRYESDHQHD